MAAGGEARNVEEVSQPLLPLWIPLATAVIYLLAFTIPYWLPAHYLNVQDELFQFTTREPWRGVLFYVSLTALFALYLLAYRSASRNQFSVTNRFRRMNAIA